MLHATYVYGQQEGKKARLRENGQWLADPPKYYDGPKFVSMDIVPPPVNTRILSARAHLARIVAVLALTSLSLLNPYLLR